jgi:hypothetical protein
MNISHQNGYLLLFRSDEWYQQLAPGEIQRVIESSKAWIERLSAQGKVKGGQALSREGAVISGRNARVISDGPFVESKEVIGGTLHLDVATLAEAITIAKTSPALAYNTTIEVRPIGDECPMDAWSRQQSQEEPLGAVTG